MQDIAHESTPRHEAVTKLAPREEAEEDDEDTVTMATPKGPRRRRRRRGGTRQHTELPGNRGKHLVGGDDGGGE